MLRTIFMIGFFALLGLFALKLVFGVLGGLMGLFLWLLGWAIRIALIGAVIYLIVRIFSPSTAAAWRRKWGGGA